MLSDIVLRPSLPEGSWADQHGCMQPASSHAPFMYPLRLKHEPSPVAAAVAAADAARAANATAAAASAAANATSADVAAAKAANATAAAKLAEAVAATIAVQQLLASGRTGNETVAVDGPAASSHAHSVNEAIAELSQTAELDARMLLSGTVRPGAAAEFQAASPAGLVVTSEDGGASATAADSVVLARVPDARYYQHWLDRTSHVMLQVSHSFAPLHGAIYKSVTAC